MSYQRKTRDEWDVQGYYSQGWEVVTTEETYKEAKKRMEEYYQNEPGPFKIVHRRVKI